MTERESLLLQVLSGSVFFLFVEIAGVRIGCLRDPDQTPNNLGLLDAG